MIGVRRFRGRSAWLVPLVLLLASLSGFGATKRYSKIEFCWTSDHRLSPHERFIEVDPQVSEVVAAIRKWITSMNKGTVLVEESTQFVSELSPDAETRFAEAQDILSRVWKSYDRNRLREWSPGEFDRLKSLMEGQVRDNAAGSGTRIAALLDHGPATVVQSRTVVGTVMMPVYSPGVTLPNPAGGVTHLPATTTMVAVPQYKDETVSFPFETRVEFLVFRKGNKTAVFARGTPRLGGVTAEYGLKNDYQWWRTVDAAKAASVVQECFKYLQRWSES